MHETTFYSLCMNNFDLIVKTIITKERKAHACRNAEKLIISKVSKQHKTDIKSKICSSMKYPAYIYKALINRPSIKTILRICANDA